jgi:hypothetical protein
VSIGGGFLVGAAERKERQNQAQFYDFHGMEHWECVRIEQLAH